MCAVSAISDHFMRQWPDYRTFPPIDYGYYQDLLRKAAEYDRMTKQPDCPDPTKLAWQKSLEEFMRKQYGLEPKREDGR
jgi:hypothetical protein